MMNIINLNKNIGFSIKIKAKFNNYTARYNAVVIYGIDEFEDYIEDMDNDDWMRGIIEELNPYDTPLEYKAQISVLGSTEIEPFVIKG